MDTGITADRMAFNTRMEIYSQITSVFDDLYLNPPITLEFDQLELAKVQVKFHYKFI